LNRRLLPLVFSCLAASPALAQSPARSYPDHPIRIIVPFDPGGPIDSLARIYGAQLQKEWGQSVIVESKPGAAGIVGMQYVASSPADGYTLVVVYLGNAMRAAMSPPTPYNLEKAFAPVAMLATTPFLLVANSKLAVHSVKELLEKAKTTKGGLTYASSGPGSPSHLAGALMQREANVELLHIPYKGQAPATQAVASGEVQFMFANPVTGLPQVRAGTFTALATSGSKRMSYAPDIPTMSESGMPNFNAETWDGLAAPAGTPKEVVQKLADQIAKIQKMPEVQKQLRDLGLEPLTEGPQKFTKRIADETAKWKTVVDDARITLQ
jgi:tripartite-type tricarboxylate transporter receptor subunit TctC